MTKLKTLKNLQFELANFPTNKFSKNYYTESLGGAAKFIDPKELKAEAVKWVKFYQMPDNENAQFIRMWIVKFFNLTGEDLK